jgi:hypothetical protein
VVKSCVDTLDSSKMWNTPNLGIVKDNWDASINLRAGVTGLGCIIRNDEGLVDGLNVVCARWRRTLCWPR